MISNMKKLFSALAFIAFATAPLFVQETMEEVNPNAPAFRVG